MTGFAHAAGTKGTVVTALLVRYIADANFAGLLLALGFTSVIGR